MKYSKTSHKSKFTGSSAFYIIIACCLIAIGSASWFAVSNYNKNENLIQSSSKKPSQSSVIDTPSVDNSNITKPPEQTQSADVAKSVSDQPYTSSSSSSSSASSNKPKISTAFSMPVQGEIIKNYSEQELQYSATYGDMRIHTALDIACEIGTSVSACANGIVLGVEENTEYGNVIIIDHGNGITVKYANVKDSKVKKDDTVTAGDIIGTVASIPCELADQSHIHIELYKNGHPASPLTLIKPE